MRSRITRRAAAKLGLAPLFVPAAALGLNGSTPASDRIALGFVGVGQRGVNNMRSFLAEPGCQVAAACDVDQNHLAGARDTANTHNGNKDCRTYHEMEEVFARSDIDAIVMSLPDHWHGIASVQALQAGKDVFGEKPLSHNWAEARAIADAVARYGRVWQTGSWQRSHASFRFACELVRNGRIGKVTRVEVGLPGGHEDFDGLGHRNLPEKPPRELDYNRWLGPAPFAPYAPARVHRTWRWNFDYGGGMLLDWVGHHVDIAHWGLGMDDSGPEEVSATGEFSTQNPIWNTPVAFRVEARYPGGAEVLISGGHDDIRLGAKFIGEEGWIWVDRAGLEAEPKSLLQSKIRGGETRLYYSPGHFRNFLDCVKTRRAPVAAAETALRSATPAYLGLISILTGRTIRWDPKKEKIVGDAVAERFLSRPMRSPWRL
ncbi:MAG: Gfo/Idh/MocA family oxidoreductase [Bryobacterales bacterium]